MLTMLKDWTGTFEVNGQTYDYNTLKSVLMDVSQPIHIVLHPQQVKSVKRANTTSVAGDKEYRITVKRYMTQKASPEFDFMAKWNHDNPMPLCTMVGVKVKETPGMVFMKLHGDIYAERITTCMKCGRVLTNPVSQYFGIGPECGHHGYVNPFNTEEELHMAVDSYKKELQSITWEGWVIKSAIKEEEEL